MLREYYLRFSNMKVSVMRFYNVAGYISISQTPGRFLIDQFTAKYLHNQDLEVYMSTPDTSCVRDYLHVSDACLAVAAVVGDNRIKRFESYDVGSATKISILEIAKLIQTQGKASKIVKKMNRVGDIAICVSTNKKISALGWAPVKTIVDIVHSTFDYHLLQNKKSEKIKK